MASPKSEAQRLLDLIYSEKLAESDKIPDGFLTVVGWAKKWGIPKRTAATHIAFALRKNIMEKKIFRIANGKQYRRMAYYRATK